MRALLLFGFCFLLHFQAQADSTSLRMLSWNVFMRPRLVFHNAQLPRTEQIIHFLKEEKYDVVVLQEVFDKKVKRLITTGLDDVYPYAIGPGKGGLIKVNSGVLILSRHPIQQKAQLFYEKACGADRMSRKGAWLAEVKKGDKVFQVIGTHCQSGKENFKVRAAQWNSLRNFCDAHLKENVPQFIVGDLNQGKKSGAKYLEMLATLNADDGPCIGGKATCNLPENDLIEVSETAKQKVIDYVLVANFPKKARVERKIRNIKKKWKKGSRKGRFLSDHAAVEACVHWQ